MLKASIVSTGNNARLKRVLEQARSGETVNIAALGGGRNRGRGSEDGTPSSLGVIRYQRDVVEELGAEPDLFILEFAVNDYGHTIMSDCIMHLIAEIDREETDERNAVPETGRKALDFRKVEMITEESEGVAITKGSFTLTDSAIQYAAGKPSFPDNWKHDKAAGNESFTVTLNCKNLLLNYKTANGADFGEAEVYVDGEKVMTLQGRTAGGWNNSNVVLVIDEDTVAEHTVEVRMAEGQEDKAFTILALGYTKE